MAPLASVFVAIRPSMVTFAGEAAAGISAARLGQAGAAQGAAFGKSFGASASKLMVAGFAVGLGALLKDSVKAAGDFETQMVRLVTSAGETGTLVSGNLKVVSEGILDMASKVGTSVSDLGKAMYTVESGSFHGADGLKVLQAAAEGAKAEGADLTKVTSAVTTALVDYHLPAEKSADITSKLVAATAAGKTTFEGLTGSLHSILPIASAAGVSIDDILGSLASMTLHGISAEEATQNMADAIRHLQNPTDVMKGELAILGIDSRHLAEDLGEKGLSGTLKMIADRIKAAMPPGSQEVFLQMSTALKGLNPEVQKLGMQLIQGTITAKEYRTESLKLDPINRAQAQQFATLAASTHRIGGEQISGAQVMQSYAGALAKATGDSASLNVALQLTGENSDNTARAIGMVSSASAEAGGHVKGWGEITETFNFKIAAMKAEFEKVGIQIGTALLPAVGELVDKVTGLLGPLSEWVKNHAELTTRIGETVGVLVGLSGGVIVISKLVGAFKSMMEILRITAAAQWLLNAAVGTNVAITSAADIQIAAYLVWSRLAAVSTKAWAVAQAALDAAFVSSPWGLIIVAIIALVAGVIYAFKHFKGFHDFIMAAWAWIKSAGIAVWHALIVAFHAVADAGIWLWQHALKPAWDGIVIGARFVWEGIKFYFAAIKMWFGIVADVAVWLYKNIFHPTFTAISFLVHAFWVVIQIYFALVKGYFENVVFPLIKLLWNGVFKPVFESIGTAAMWLWQHAIKPFVAGLVVDFNLLMSVLRPLWNGLVSLLVDYVGPAFVWLWHHVIEPFWHGIQDAAELVWNKGLKPLFQNLVDFVTKDIPGAFSKSVDFVGKAWDKIKSAVSTPISWVIDHVINGGIIDSINKVADFVGVKDRIPHVANPFSSGGGGGGSGGRAPMFMADGGLLSGPGGPRDDLIPIMASAGEYIIPAHVVKDIGVSYFDSLIGRRKPQFPGDGSSGIAVGHFADGGLVEAITSPAKWLGGKVDSLIGGIPGAGAFKNLAVGTARKLVTFLVKWVENKLGFGDAGGNVGAAQAFIRSQAGKPYIWASAGPDGYDCCIIAGVRIYGPQGAKPIDQVRAGDRVYSYVNGKLEDHAVTAAWQSKRQEVFAVRTRNRTVTASANHPFLRLIETGTEIVEHREDGEWAGAPRPYARRPKLTSCSVSTCSAPVFSNDMCRTHRQRWYKHGDPRITLSRRTAFDVEWARVDELRRGDLLVQPRQMDADVEQNPVLADGTPIDADLAWLIGASVGDGTVTDRSLRLCLYGADRDRATAVLSARWPNKVAHGARYGLLTSNTALAESMAALGMRVLGPEKRVPAAVWTWPAALRRAFLNGYCDADGHRPTNQKRHGERTYHSASRELIEDVRALHIMLGDPVSNIHVTRRTKPIVIKGKVVKNARDQHAFTVYPDNGHGEARMRLMPGLGEWLDAGDFTLGTVLAIDPEGEQDTWDLNIEGSHNFIADGVVVHNSGIVSAVWNLLHGKSPYSHTFSTGNEAPYFPHPGMGVFTAGWANPGERGGGSVGHTAGWLAGLPFESTGSQGVHIGSGVTPVDSFAHMGHMAAGGLVKVPRFDRGGTLRRGLNLVNNATGAEERLHNAGMPMRLDDYTIARLAQAMQVRPTKVEIMGPDLGLTVAGVAP